MDIGTLRGVLTALLLLLFIGVVAWAYSRRRRADFDKAASLPLEDDTRPPATHDDNNGEARS